jgi:RNA polymerase sigma factor (sigma-70 family)
MTALAITALERQLAGDVASAARGDRDAFARLIAATSGVVCAVALAITRDVPSSEDVAQEAFLAAWLGLPRLRDPASFLPWLRQVTRFRARSWLRGGAARGARGGDEAALAAVTDPGLTAEQQLLAAEDRRALDEAFAALPEDAREVVTLYYREGASTAQLADLLGASEAAIRQRLARARGALRAHLLDRVGETLRKTSPGVALSAAVLALTVATPGTATAATLAAAGKSSLASKLLPVAGGVGLGVSAGLAGVVLGLRRHLREAIDDDERLELRRFRRAAIITVVLAGLGYALTGLCHSAALGIATQLGFGAAMFALYGWRLPRITGRRDPIRIAADPGFARIVRRRRRVSLIALVVGYAVSTWSLVHTLRAAEHAALHRGPTRPRGVLDDGRQIGAHGPPAERGHRARGVGDQARGIAGAARADHVRHRLANDPRRHLDHVAHRAAATEPPAGGPRGSAGARAPRAVTTRRAPSQVR